MSNYCLFIGKHFGWMITKQGFYLTEAHCSHRVGSSCSKVEKQPFFYQPWLFSTPRWTNKNLHISHFWQQVKHYITLPMVRVPFTPERLKCITNQCVCTASDYIIDWHVYHVYIGGSAGQHRRTAVRPADTVEAVSGTVWSVPVASWRLERVYPDPCWPQQWLWHGRSVQTSAVSWLLHK